MTDRICTHTDAIRPVQAQITGCEECLAAGTDWVALRLCRTCGHVGCCDMSGGKHARKHFEATQHPLARGLEPGEKWTWCYLDEIYLPEEEAA